MLRKFLDDVDNGYDRTHPCSPVAHGASTDPMMPTLSPQQPAALGGGAAMLPAATPLTVNTTVESALLHPTLNDQLPISSSAGGKGVSNMPPCLLNSATATTKESPLSRPMDWEASQLPKVSFLLQFRCF